MQHTITAALLLTLRPLSALSSPASHFLGHAWVKAACDSPWMAVGVSKSRCLLCLGTASFPKATLSHSTTPYRDQNRVCSTPINSTQLSQVHPVPSSFHRLSSSIQHSVAPHTSPHSHSRPTQLQSSSWFCSLGQHYNFNHKVPALDISPTLMSLSRPLVLRQSCAGSQEEHCRRLPLV